MPVAYTITNVIDTLKSRIESDHHFDPHQTRQIHCLIDSITEKIHNLSDITPPCPIDLTMASYPKYISVLYTSVNNSDQMQPETKHAVLYAIEELQKCLWRH